MARSCARAPPASVGSSGLPARAGAIAVSIGGKLKSRRFIGHYIHLDESCEGRAGGPFVLESGDDDRIFSLATAPKEACQ